MESLSREFLELAKRKNFIHLAVRSLIQTSLLYLFQQRRGLDDRELLPYFPYRDDGEQILQVIENMMKDYVDL